MDSTMRNSGSASAAAAAASSSSGAVPIAMAQAGFMRHLLWIESYTWLYALLLAFQVAFGAIDALRDLRLPLWYAAHVMLPCLGFSAALFLGIPSAGGTTARLDKNGARFLVHAINLIVVNSLACGANIAYMVVQIIRLVSDTCGAPCSMLSMAVVTVVLAGLMAILNALCVVGICLLWYRESCDAARRRM